MKTITIIRGICLCIAISVIASNAFAQSVIISPTGGEELTAGSTQTVSWNPKLVTGMLTLSLFDGEHAKWSDVFANVPAEEGQICWTVPSYLQGRKFRMKLSTNGTVSGYTFSPAFFTIASPAPKVESSVPGVTIPIVCTLQPNPASAVTRICVEDLPEGVPATLDSTNDVVERFI